MIKTKSKSVYPEVLVVGTVTVDFAVFVYSILFFIGATNKDFKCYFITDLFDVNYRDTHVLMKASFVTSLIATFLGWFTTTVLTVYTFEVLKSIDGKVPDPYELAKVTPGLAIATAFFLSLTVYLFGNFKTSACSILMVISIAFLVVGAYFLLRHFEMEREREAEEKKKNRRRPTLRRTFRQSQLLRQQRQERMRQHHEEYMMEVERQESNSTRIL